MKLCPLRFGFAFGLIWGVGMMLIGWAAWLWHYGQMFINVWSSVYLGYQPTFVGGIIGGLWGFVDFFVFGFLVIWIYNRCLSKK